MPAGKLLDCRKFLVCHSWGEANMQKSILEAIQQGDWEFEPVRVAEDEFPATRALPGSGEKLQILAARVAAGLPLWHAGDRRDYEDLRFLQHNR
jgi:hypothetical protein